MRVLVTGATGFLGSHVADKLQAKGHDVRALVRESSRTDALKKKQVQIVQGSLEGNRGLHEAMQDIDAVVHCAGLVKARTPEEFHAVNALGAKYLAEAAAEVRPDLRRFVYVSSLAAHGASPDGRPRNPADPPSPVTHYGKSKLAGERYVLALKDRIPVTIFRPPAIYGPRDREMYSFFKSIRNRVVPLVGRGHTLSVIYGPDCADAIVASVEKDHASGNVYFVDDGQVYSWEEMGRALQHALGVRAWELKIPRPVFVAAALGSELYGRVRNQPVMLTRNKLEELSQKHWVCDSESLRKDLGWSPTVNVHEGAKLTARWYKEHGWL